MNAAAQDFDIVGVTDASARRWLAGQVWATAGSDLDTSKAEAIFLNELGNRESYRAAIAKIHELYRAGAGYAIAHSCSELMTTRYLWQGGEIRQSERIDWRGETHTAHRIFIPPAALAAWIAKT